MKKKVFSLLIPLLILGLTGCVKYNGQEKSSKKSNNTPSSEVAPQSEAQQQTSDNEQLSSVEQQSIVGNNSSSSAGENNEGNLPAGTDVKVYLAFGEYGKYQGNLFISLELMRGRTLKDILDSRGYLSKSDAISYVLQLLDATKHIHERKVLHNDIKPENVFMFLDGNIKLIDFGIATQFDEEADKVNVSILYTAPEVLRSGHYSVQSDIYSTGVLLFELLTGKNPFDKYTKTEEVISYRLQADVPSLRGLVHFSEDLDSLNYVIGKATNKVINQRYKTDDEFIADLLKIKEGQKLGKRNIFQRIFGK